MIEVKAGLSDFFIPPNSEVVTVAKQGNQIAILGRKVVCEKP
jgi:hypothetical protein